MSIIREAIQLLLDTGKATKTTEIKDFPNDPDKRLLIKPDGTHEVLDTRRPPRKRGHVVATIEDFNSACEHLVAPSDPSPSPVWFSERRVVIFPDDRYREDVIALELPASEQLELLEVWQAPTVLTQPQLVRTLRHDLAGCVDPAVLQAFRTVNFQVMQNAARTIQHAQQSMDRDVAAAVVGPEKPQEFIVNIPLFNHPDFRSPACSFAFKVTVDIDCQGQTFTLQLAPGDYVRAIEKSTQLVRTTLASALEGATLIAGVP